MAGPGQKVVLITGCSSGIGLRMAVMLAKDEQRRYHGECTPAVVCRGIQSEQVVFGGLVQLRVYCITALQYYCITVLLHYSTVVRLGWLGLG